MLLRQLSSQRRSDRDPKVDEEIKALLGAQQKGIPWYRYNSLIRGHLMPRLGSIALAKLQPADCAAAFAAMAQKGLAPRTIIQPRAVLGRALHEAEIAGLVGRNAARLTRPRASSTPR